MSDDEDDSPKCFMAKGRKVKSQSPPLASDDDDCNDVDDCDNVFKGLSKNAMSRIKEMLDTIDMHEETLETQEDLLIHEKERNDELEGLLAKEKEKVEKLTKKFDLVNSSIVSLESKNSKLQEEFTLFR